MTTGQPPCTHHNFLHACSALVVLNTSVTQLAGMAVRTQLYRGWVEILTVRIEPILSGSHSNT